MKSQLLLYGLAGFGLLCLLYFVVMALIKSKGRRRQP